MNDKIEKKKKIYDHKLVSLFLNNTFYFSNNFNQIFFSFLAISTEVELIEEAILAPPQSSGENLAYIPMDYAKECIQKVFLSLKDFFTPSMFRIPGNN